MDMLLNDDQTLLLRSIGDFLDGEGLGVGAPKNAQSPSRLRELWRACAEMGWLRSCLPEEAGGLGLGLLDAAVMQEEMGRRLLSLPVADAVAIQACLPGPVVSSLSDWFLGEQCLGMVRQKASSAAENAPIHRTEMVEYALPGGLALALDWTSGEMRSRRVAIDQIGHGLDPLIATGGAQENSAMDCVRASLDAAGWRRFLWFRGGLRLAELLGVGAEAMDMASRYACEREQFGRPIGANQAIKHRLADDWMALDNARLALHEACRLLDEGDDAPCESAMLDACLLTVEAARDATAHAVQIHGAMGITWECPVHFYLKRARHLTALLGMEVNPAVILDRLWVLGGCD